MKKTALNKTHILDDAKMVDFAGWNMPLNYKNGIISEVKSVRNSVGMFDVSHMGRIKFNKAKSIDILDKLISINIYKIKNGKCKYNLICNESGGIIDDAIISNLNDEIFLVVNAINSEKVVNWFNKFGANNTNMSIITNESSMIALQGPDTFKILNIISDNEIILPKFGISKIQLKDINCYISATGYTGENGVEIITDNKDINKLWNLLKENNVNPCGLASRDILRIEAGLPLYGNELNEQITPLEAGLQKFANTYSKNYIVDQKFRNYSPKKKLIGIKLIEKGIPRKNQTLLDENSNEIIGEVTSGTFSPTLNSGIGLAYIKTKKLPENNSLFVDIRGKKIKAKVVDIPFTNSKALK